MLLRASSRRGSCACLILAALLGAAVQSLAGCDSLPYEKVTLDFKERTPTAFARHPAGWLKVALAPILSPRVSATDYRVLFHKLGSDLGRSVDLIYGRSHRQTIELVAAGRVDLALIGSGDYLALRKREPRVEALAVGRSREGLQTHALLLVRVGSAFSSFEQLRGKRFAFTAPSSISGHLFPQLLLARQGASPADFFAGHVYTESQDRALQAVNSGLQDATSIDALGFDYLRATGSELTRGVRVIARSKPYANPPIVAGPRSTPAQRARWRNALLRLHTRPAALSALQKLQLQRFEAPPKGLYVDPLTAWSQAR